MDLDGLTSLKIYGSGALMADGTGSDSQTGPGSWDPGPKSRVRTRVGLDSGLVPLDGARGVNRIGDNVDGSETDIHRE